MQQTNYAGMLNLVLAGAHRHRHTDNIDDIEPNTRTCEWLRKQHRHEHTHTKKEIIQVA